MYLLGTTLTNALAVLAAVMTVTAGVPLSACQCPDGRIKLFCQGTAAAAADSCGPARGTPPPGTTSCCGTAKPVAPHTPPAPVKKRSCCGRSHAGPPNESAGGGSRAVIQAGSCVKTTVAGNPVDAVTAAGVTADHVVDAISLCNPDVVIPPPVSAAVAARPPPGSSTPPPDLVVLLCHFTC